MEEKNELIPSEETGLAKPEEETPWLKLSDKAKQGLEIAKKTQKTKHGLFANIPIVCKADDCPYIDTCPAYQNNLAPAGEPCVVEVALIMKLYEDCVKEFGIDSPQIVQLDLVKTFINASVILHRCQAILAKDGNILPDRIVSVTQSGMVFRQPDAHPALAIMDKAINQKNQAWQLLNSTPKDKAKTDATVIIDPSTYASKILKKYKETLRNKQQEEGEIIDVTPKNQGVNENPPPTD